MILALIAGAFAATASAAAPAQFEVRIASTPMTAASEIKRLTSALYRLKQVDDRKGYARVRLGLLENIALLQHWAQPASTPQSTERSFRAKMNPAGRKALGARKPTAGDFRRP